MQLIICSDIHDNIWTLEKALRAMEGADAMVFCGDFCAPFTLVQMAEAFAGPIHVVWGNNDGDKWLLTQQASRFAQVQLHGDMAEIEVGSIRLVAAHSGKVVCVVAARHDDGTRIHTWQDLGVPDQRWELIPARFVSAWSAAAAWAGYMQCRS